MINLGLRGKMVAAVYADENEDGWPTTVIELSDGTGLRVVAHGQDETDQAIDMIDSVEVDALVAEFDRREQERRARQAEIDAFNALSQDEKDRIRADRRAAMSPLERAMWDSIIEYHNEGLDFGRSILIPKVTKRNKARRS